MSDIEKNEVEMRCLVNTCSFCNKNSTLRDCKRYETSICRFCCKKNQSYNECEGCSFRVWTPDQPQPAQRWEGLWGQKLQKGKERKQFKKRLAQELEKMPKVLCPLPFIEEEGIVYVLRSKRDPELVKIGYTLRSASQRLKDFRPNRPLERKNGVKDYNSYYYQLDLGPELEICGGELVEKIAHGFLEKLERKIKGEVFKCTQEDINTLFQNYS